MPRVNVPGVGVVEFPNDMPMAAIARESERLSKSAAPAASTQAGIQPAPKTEPLAKWTLDAMPALGGGIGGATGTALGLPGGPAGFATGVGGAYLGGNIGELVRQTGYGMLGYGAPKPLSLESLMEANRQGASQMYAEAGGRGIERALKPAAKGLMKLSLMAPKRAELEAGRLELARETAGELGSESAMQHPALTSLEERLTGSNKSAAEVARKTAEEAAAQRAEASAKWGMTTNASELTNKLVDRIQRKTGSQMTVQEHNALWQDVYNRVNEVLGNPSYGTIKHTTNRWGPEEMQIALQELNNAAKPEYTKQAAGKLASVNPSLDKDIASAIREALVEGIPGQGAARTRNQYAKGAASAWENANASPSRMRNWTIPIGAMGAAGAFGPNSAVLDAALAGLATWAAGNRRVQNFTARQLDKQGTADLARQIPRLLEQLLSDRSGGYAPPDSTR